MRDALRKRLEILRAKHGAQSIYALLVYKNVEEAHGVAVELLQLETGSRPVNCEDDPFYFCYFKEGSRVANCLSKAYESAVWWLRMTENKQRRLLEAKNIYDEETKQQDIEDDLFYASSAAQSVIREAAAEIQKMF